MVINFSVRAGKINRGEHPAAKRVFPALIFGGLAQLGERLAGSQKVRGSSPLSSTSYNSGQSFDLERAC